MAGSDAALPAFRRRLTNTMKNHTVSCMSAPDQDRENTSRSAPSASDADLSGRRLGDFRLLRRLGRGAMAEVYLAEQEHLKRRVAVKVLKPELAGDRTYLQRFEIEAQAAASLIHANIVQIYEVGCVDQLHYIAQEYVQGQNLHEYIVRHGPPDLPHALSIMRQVAAALAKAAEQGVVHRDIKPENIMLTAGGEVKVADFGLARITRETSGMELTQVGITLGTPLYMSPEQVEGKPLDPRSDIYSFGVTCYHMLSGSPPFLGETVLGVAVQHLKKTPEPLETKRPDLPPALCRMVHQMLAKDPARRFESARDLLRELRRVQVEHFGDDWPEDLPSWDSLAAEIPADPRIALTRQLDDLMKSATAARASRWRAGRLAACVLVAFAVGAAAAWRWAAPTPLLADAKSVGSGIAHLKSAEGQYILASQLQTEAAWQSVIDYVPKNESISCHARQQLAYMYLLNDDLDHAMGVFAELAKLNPGNEKIEKELRAFGLAGQCIVLSRLGKYEDSNNLLLGPLWNVCDRLTAPMQRLLRAAVIKNGHGLKKEADEKLKRWLETTSKPGEEG